MAIYKGKGIGEYMASGTLRFFNKKSKNTTGVFEIGTVPEELEKYQIARERVSRALDRLYERAIHEVGKERAEIFEIHKMLLYDEDYCEIIELEIKSGVGAKEAIICATNKLIDVFSSLDDEYLRSRASDLRDISSQLLNNLENNAGAEKIDTSPCILVARDLTPSQTMSLDKSSLLGFVTFEGSATSHTSILARAMDIPALVGVGEIDEAYDGKIALLDAQEQALIIEPTSEQIIEFEKKLEQKKREKQKNEQSLRALLSSPATAKNGHRVLIYSNIGGDYEVEKAFENGAEGVGLLRSEMLYLRSSRLPCENELFEAYKSVIIKAQGKRVIIRTLDIGADKKVPYLDLGSEENPALGFRGIRLTLENKGLFKTQIRAILRASIYGKASIMLPMIISRDEVLKSRELIEICKQELFDENLAFDSKIELGIMIETPASALIANDLAALVDFFSVGTNDLIQYTLAIDRQNPRVAELASNNLEPVLMLIENCARAIHQRGGFIGICGELASDTSLTQRFVDMKIDELSVSTPYLLSIRRQVKECF